MSSKHIGFFGSSYTIAGTFLVNSFLFFYKTEYCGLSWALLQQVQACDDDDDDDVRYISIMSLLRCEKFLITLLTLVKHAYANALFPRLHGTSDLRLLRSLSLKHRKLPC